jgi:hypothetical protein
MPLLSFWRTSLNVQATFFYLEPQKYLWLAHSFILSAYVLHVLKNHLDVDRSSKRGLIVLCCWELWVKSLFSFLEVYFDPVNENIWLVGLLLPFSSNGIFFHVTRYMAPEIIINDGGCWVSLHVILLTSSFSFWWEKLICLDKIRYILYSFHQDIMNASIGGPSVRKMSFCPSRVKMGGEGMCLSLSFF